MPFQENGTARNKHFNRAKFGGTSVKFDKFVFGNSSRNEERSLPLAYFISFPITFQLSIPVVDFVGGTHYGKSYKFQLLGFLVLWILFFFSFYLILVLL